MPSIKEVYHINGFLSYSQYFKVLLYIQRKYIRIFFIEIRNEILSGQYGTQKEIHNPLTMRLLFNQKINFL